MSKKPKTEEILITAQSIDGRILQIVIFPEHTIKPVELVARLNNGSLLLDNLQVLDPQLHEVVGEITNNSYDARATEYRGFSLNDEAFMPLDEVPDKDLLGYIDGLRGLIDGKDDGLSDMLTPHLGFLLAERAKRERQRRSDED